MTFGIREKVSLLVFVATGLSAFLVARGVALKSKEVLGEHELVDLGDEALLQGWTLSDKVDGLAEDLMNLAFSPEFQDAVEAGLSPGELNKTAHRYCRRYWNDYLHIDLVSFEGENPSVTTIRKTVEMDEENLWLPPLESSIGAQLYLSQIMRLNLVRLIDGKEEDRTRPQAHLVLLPGRHHAHALRGRAAGLVLRLSGL